jgi:HAD superfamily hydrolase (TIGR01549 family)
MKHLETIFLDAGGVLVWPNWDRIAATLGAHGVAVDPQRLAAADPRVRVMIDNEELIASSTDQRRGWTYLEQVLAEAGAAPSDGMAAALDELQVYHHDHNLWDLVPGFVVPTLSDLRQAGYRLVIVSNSNGTLARLLARVGIAPLVDVILDSQIERIEKPDVRFFELALERSGASRQSTVHVGDIYHVDVVGARRAGLSAVLVDEADMRSWADCPRIRDLQGLPALLADADAFGSPA